MKLRIWFALALLPLSLPAQQRPMAFEVASIKPAPEGVVRISMSVEGTRVDLRGVTLRIIAGQAFGVRPIYVLGDDWLGTAKFEISATIPEGRTKQDVPALLQALLAERFGLRVHRKMRDMPVYALIVAKGGAKLKEVSAEAPDALKTSTNSMVIVGTLDALGPPGSFAGLKSPVINATGLKGKYEMPIDPKVIYGDMGARSSNPVDDEVESVERMNQAISPLGLKLERRKVPTEALVVDHIEHVPTGN